MRSVSAPMAARTSASRTTTNTKGWLFSALGAWVAAVRIRATVSSSTSSGRNERAARWVCTTSKKSGMAADGTDRSGWAAHGARIGRRRGGPATFGAAPARAGARHDDLVGVRRRTGRGGTPWQTTPHQQEDVLKSFIGQPTGKSKVVVERGPVQHFADALLSASPIYHDPAAAKQAGFDNIPAPPTWPFAMEFSGKFAEMQPADAPTGSPLAKILGPLMAKGGLILHGEEEFLYHRPMQVGDVLIGDGVISDVYQKESKGRTMTFICSETKWTEESTGEPVVTARMNLIHRS